MVNLKLNYKLVENFITRFIKEETYSNGFQKGVIGLSGGIDSALVVYLTAKALGKENTKAIIMPYKSSSPNSLEDAKLIINKLDIPYEIIDITPLAEPYFALNKKIDKLRKGNFLARLRMCALFDKAKESKALVMGTSNKSELMLGYSTWYGDMAASLYPIGDLYKTQIFNLSKFIGVPEKIINKKPTADLWPGQTDEEELGATYKELDSVLSLYVDQRKTKEEILQLGYKKELVKNIFHRVYVTQFKRTSPPVAKFSARTIGIDFLYPHDFKR